MNKMIEKVRQDKKGFTLAELLIVVAIILVLVAIAIPVFMGAQTEAEKAVKAANERSVKAEVTTVYLLEGKDKPEKTYYVDGQGNITVTKPTDAKWQYNVVIDDTADPTHPTITVTQAEVSE